MAAETRVSIAFKEIKRIGLRCENCEAELWVSVEQARVADRCSPCGHEWPAGDGHFDQGRHYAEQGFLNFLKALGRSHHTKQPGVSLLFESPQPSKKS